MPRLARKLGKSKVYHIILRGINRQLIFYDDEDRTVFLNQLLITIEKYKYEVFAYCLMSNHVHLVLKIQDDFLSKAIQSLAIRYSKYFNEKYKRSGHFFENRYKSKIVEDRKYFLDVCRYVHRNPEKAGVCATNDYIWSSYHEYIGKETIINKKTLMCYYQNEIEQFINYTLKERKDDDNTYAEYELLDRIPDDELTEIILRTLKMKSIEDISNLNIRLQKKLISKLKKIEGTNITQLSRILKINRTIIKSVFD